jgi:putative transposase
MARKWSNLNLPGALHFVTGNFIDRIPGLTESSCCKAFLGELQTLLQQWPAKLIAYVLIPDHFHLILNPKDGRIIEFLRDLKSKSAKAIVKTTRPFQFPLTEEGHQVWQESFKGQPLWSEWMAWQKIHYIHANPVKAKLVKSARDYHWSSFRSFYSQGDCPLAIDREWCWPDDSEKLSKAMKELGWHDYWKREK